MYLSMLGARITDIHVSLDSDDVPLSVSFSSVGNGWSPRFKAEESCRNFLAGDGGKSIPSLTRDLLCYD